ncbi:MAG: OmpH family outer membrane protein [Planctomycetota bacterium]
MNIRTVVLALLVAPFLLAQDNPAGKSAVEASATKVPAISVGVVDLVKAFEQYPRWIKFRGELQKRADAMKVRMAEMGKAVDEQRAAIEILDKESEERRDGELQLALMEQQRRETRKRLEEKFALEEARLMLLIYEDLEVACRKVAEARGVAIVQRVYDIEPATGDVAKLSADSVQKRMLLFERKQIWYASQQVDLTPDVIKFLMVPLDEPKAGDKAAAPAPEPKKETAKDASKAGGQ